ncbi:hypothetical protein BD769DRAFT_1481626 [Suillus cothurnatus]|nr:hypothetical protein BD769DRAFT_1481626 [Suillus cothurnatus]
MFVRIFTLFLTFLFLCQAHVMATAIMTSSNSTSCGDGQTRCCKEELSDLGSVDDEQCQSFSGKCSSGYVTSCCHTVAVNVTTCLIQQFD